jgi:hypothetical protein
MISGSVAIIIVVGWVLLVSRTSVLWLFYGVFLMISAVGVLFFKNGLAVAPSNLVSGRGEVEIAGVLLVVLLFLFLMLGLALTARLYLLKKNVSIADIQNLKNS